MCLTVQPSDTYKIANEDIYCWKVVDRVSDFFSRKFNGTYVSPFQRAAIEFNTKLDSPFTTASQNNSIAYGFHTIVVFNDARKLAKKLYGGNFILVRAIIPKGSRYWTGTCSSSYLSFCSDMVMYKKPILLKIRDFFKLK